MGYFIHAEGINHLYSSSARSGWERGPALGSGVRCLSRGAGASSKWPLCPSTSPCGVGATLNYNLENCSASPASPPSMTLSLQSSQPPKLKARKGVSLFWGHATCPCCEVREDQTCHPQGPETPNSPSVPGTWFRGAVMNLGREGLGRAGGLSPPCLHPEDMRVFPGPASSQGAGRGGLKNTYVGYPHASHPFLHPLPLWPLGIDPGACRIR